MNKILIIVAFSCVFLSCSKFLDVKPDQKLATISTPEDLWALVNNENILNSMHMIGEDLADNYVLRNGVWNSITNETVRNKYIWKTTEYDDVAWTVFYTKIYHTNNILDAAEKVKSKLSEKDYREIVGAALYYRSWYFNELVTIYSLPYFQGSNASSLGISLRTTADITVSFPRSTVAESYEKLISDLREASDMLPEQSILTTRPSKMAAESLLARIYLNQGDYENAYTHSLKALKIRDNLLDYNLLDSSLVFPFPLYTRNADIIHYISGYSQLLTPNNCFVDPSMYENYKDKDLRKVLFFKSGLDGTVGIKANYTPDEYNHFTGMSMGELYLIFVEAALRTNRMTEATNRFLIFLQHRYTPAEQHELSGTQEQMLENVLEERRRELMFRNRRWEDVRRLNLSGHTIALTRYLNGEMFALQPGSLEYALLLPLEAVEYGRLQQNKR